MFEEPKPLSFDELQASENHRRELLKRGQTARYSRYLQLWDTILPTVFTTLEFLLSCTVFFIVRILMWYEVVDSTNVGDLDFKWVQVIGGFITFLLVFYNNQIYSRFVLQYDSTSKAKSSVQTCALLARDNLPSAMAWQFVRYLNGVHLLGIVGLSETYSSHNMFVPLNDELQLFTPQEVARLEAIDVDNGGVCFREVLGWAFTILRIARDEKYIDNTIYQMMMAEVLQVRSALGTLFNLNDQPIPFLYVHLIYFLCIFYLFLFSFFVAITFDYEDSWGNLIAILIVLLNNIFTVGLLEIGKFMSDPFGADNCDLSVIRYIRDTVTGSRRILTGSFFELTTMDVEISLEQRRPKKGQGYAMGSMSMEKLSQDKALKNAHVAANKDDATDVDGVQLSPILDL